MKLFRTLQSRSPETRQKIAGVSAIVVTAIIFMVWVADLGYRFSHPQAQAEGGEETTTSPFATIKDSIAYFFSEARTSIDTGIEMFDGAERVAPVEVENTAVEEKGEAEEEAVPLPGVADSLPDDISELDTEYEVIGDTSLPEEAETETEGEIENN